MKAENIIVILSKVFLWERLMVSWEEHGYVESDGDAPSAEILCLRCCYNKSGAIQCEPTA